MKLKRVLLNNWLYYSHEVIRFEEINLLTGKTGQGKSAFLDALNIVLYGEVKSWNFNKAANDKSNRSVISYLKGKYKDRGYLRDQGLFDTYIVLEFAREDGSMFCEGIVFEVDGRSDHERHHFFTLNHGIPEHEFLREDGCAYTIKDLRTMVKESQDERSKLFDRHEDYQDDLRLKCRIKDTKQFIKISKKALSYATIDKIDNFIIENICDFDRKVDIEQLLNEMRDYRELADLLRNMKQKKERLEKIQELQQQVGEQHTLLHEYQREQLVKQYQLLQAEKAQNKDAQEQKRKEKQVQEELIQQCEQEKNAADEAWSFAQNAYQNSELAHFEERLARMKEQYEQTKQDYLKKQQQILNILYAYHQKIDALDAIESKLPQEVAGILTELFLSIQKIENIIDKEQYEEEETSEIRYEQLRHLHEALEQLHRDKKQEIQKLQAQMQESEQLIQQYQSGIKSYPKELLSLKEIIETRLQERYGTKIPLFILADLMEIKEKEWTNAIEGFLGKRKYNLIVEPQYFQEAIAIYQQDPRLQNIYEYSIVDTSHIQPRKKVEVKTLYDCVSCDHAGANAYLQYLLAGVVLCERVEELNHYPVSITKDCMLYQSYAVRRIHEKNWKKHYIGRTALASLLEQEQQVYASDQEVMKGLQEEEALLSRLQLNSGEDMKYTMNTYRISCISYHNIEQGYEELQKQFAQLNQQEAEELKHTLYLRAQKKKEAEQRYYDAKSKKDQILNELEQAKIAYANHQRECEEFETAHAQDMAWILQEQQPADCDTLQKRIVFLQQEMDKLKSLLLRLESDLLNEKKDYNREFQLSLNESIESDEFQREYLKYPSREILANEERFKEKERLAKETFENSFLGSLKKRIDGTKQAIDDLNASISRIPFGHSKYRFKMEPKKEYEEIYQVIMCDELNGRSLWNTQAYEEHQSILDDLFQQISEYSMSTDFYVREQLKARVENLSDYTTYLEFDITDNGESLKKSITDKSGGETQTPFYIAILASLMNCYRDKNAEKLVLLDEAFDKMDSERIKECINLLRDLHFQAIVVTTNDKIINLGGIVDSVKVAKTKEASGRRVSTIMNFFKEQEYEISTRN